MRKLRVMLTFGTRPEAIKMAPLVHACHRRADLLEAIVCTTGQHREMLDQVTGYFGVKVDCDLALMTPNQTLADFTARCLKSLDVVLAEYQPDCLVVQGDTTTVLAAGMAAFYRRIPLVHVEAGLRTGNMQAPWPEEFNRRVAGLVAALHCAPTAWAADNLLREGVAPERVYVTGNTVIDALLWTVARERKRSGFWQKKYAFLGRRPLVLITGHRRENFGEGLERVCTAIGILAKRFPEVEFLYPVHLNPHVQEPVQRLLSGRKNVYLQPPAAYPEFVWLMDRATLILTDSGGVQEEAPSLRKPVLVTRETTERPEALQAGAIALVGTEVKRIVEQTSLLLSDAEIYRQRQIDRNPYGDGHAAEHILELMLQQDWAKAAMSELGRPRLSEAA